MFGGLGMINITHKVNVWASINVKDNVDYSWRRSVDLNCGYILFRQMNRTIVLNLSQTIRRSTIRGNL